MKAILYTDGGAPPSESYACWILFTEQLEPLTPIFKVTLTQGTTSNEAEYHAIIHGVQYAQAHKYELIEIRSDSKLIINQITGVWRVRTPHLMPLHHKARALVNDTKLVHVASKSNPADPKGKSKHVQQFETTDITNSESTDKNHNKAIEVISMQTEAKQSGTHPIDSILQQFSQDYKNAPPEAQRKAMALLVEAVNILIKSSNGTSNKWV